MGFKKFIAERNLNPKLGEALSDEVKIFGDGRCAVCPKRTPMGKLMCNPHWRDVPADLKNKVYRAWSKWNKNTGTLEALREAQMAAIASVE